MGLLKQRSIRVGSGTFSHPFDCELACFRLLLLSTNFILFYFGLLSMFRTSLTRLSRSTVQRWTAASASRPAAVARVMAIRAMATTGGATLAELRASSPHVDVVRYEHKNRTWSLNHVDYYATAMAIGFIDAGLRPSDVVLSWLPDHFSEQVRVLQQVRYRFFFVFKFEIARANADDEIFNEKLSPPKNMNCNHRGAMEWIVFQHIFSSNNIIFLTSSIFILCIQNNCFNR